MHAESPCSLSPESNAMETSGDSSAEKVSPCKHASKRLTPNSRFVAPKADRSSLVIPSFDDVELLVCENRRLRAEVYPRVDLYGRSLADVSSQARRDLLTAAQFWTALYRDDDFPSFDPDGPLFIAGHQPELFHPGVWFKNFALGAVAQQCGAAAVNLVIDSDAMKSSALATPCGSVSNPRRESIPFDDPLARLPFEERPIVNREKFARFGQRVSKRISTLVANPLIDTFWPMVIDRAKDFDRPGYCIAQARHKLEGQWGVKTLEAPQSAVCDGDAFYWFLAFLIGELPRFHNDYNTAVHEYRAENEIPNAAHPVPDLTVDGPWIEAPFWVWTKTNPERRRLFAQRAGDACILTDHEGWELRLPLGSERSTPDLTRAVQALSEAARSGVKIRTRALATTLWGRLALGDLFLHGIGGAKYDQVTDRLIEKFFGFRPPAIMVLSATLMLPVARPNASADSLRAIRRELRELTYHPDRHLPPGASDQALKLVQEKWRWIHMPVTPENAYARHSAINRTNMSLEPFVADRRQGVLQRQTQTEVDLRRNKILAARDHGFCLFPGEMLREFFTSLVP